MGNPPTRSAFDPEEQEYVAFQYSLAQGEAVIKMPITHTYQQINHG